MVNYTVKGNEIIISNLSEFALEPTFECGQCFRWNRDEKGIYRGIAFKKHIALREEEDRVIIETSEEDFQNIWRDYFDLDRDYGEIKAKVSINDHMKKAAQFGTGIRILRQDKWEALCSFIISQCNNIPRIKSIVEKLSALYGDQIGEDQFAFPDSGVIAGLEESDLAPLRAGYRAKYIIQGARAVSQGEIDMESLAQASYEEAVLRLKEIPGVGDKVASCVALFGLNKLDAFPIDTWMKKAIDTYYGKGFDPAVFSPYGGIAQQYMFYYERSGKA